ncbi:hypothetical protein AGMMS49592_0440 [Endomicrobiia bacterium]|nr:hypothetical protein AGMMS49592_0440 [Endomicrobiia bacterium]
MENLEKNIKRMNACSVDRELRFGEHSELEFLRNEVATYERIIFKMEKFIK